MALTLIFIFLTPALLAIIGKVAGLARTTLGTCLVVVTAGTLPALYVFIETQQADGITRAASVIVSPILGFFGLMTAGTALLIWPSRWVFGDRRGHLIER